VLALAAALVVSLGASDRAIAQDKDKKQTAPKFLYGHDVLVRPGGQTDWVKASKIGFEVFQDDSTNTIVGITEKGWLTVIPAATVGAETKCKWLTAHDLATRKAGELEFTASTKKYGVELFRDLGANRLLYVCETAALAFAPIPGGLVTDKGPKWHHAMEPKVRAIGEKDFDKAKRFGLEVFKDENTGGLIYITEVGAIATAAAPPSFPDPKQIAPPKPVYGLELRVRRADEPDFTEKTKRVAIEVFEDPNAKNLQFYITDTGAIATAPSPAKPTDTRGVTWKSAMILKARKGGDPKFDNAAKYGIEVFQDNRNGNLIFICETGAIAVLPKAG
jgi:hypothetical protein